LELPPGGLPEADLILAADGGAKHCRALGIWPQMLIGDLDSLEPALRAELAGRRVQLISHPARKDETDFELALLHARQAGAEAVSVLGGLGRRWDHSLANLTLAAAERFAGLHITFLHGSQRLLALRGQATLEATPGSRVSLIPLGQDARGVTTRGLEYPLMDETLPFGSSRGVSNVVTSENPSVEIAAGVLLCVLSPGEFE
jgi:thiamine pyrophosphokinase